MSEEKSLLDVAIEKLHDSIDADLECVLVDAGDASFIPQITEVVDSLLPRTITFDGYECENDLWITLCKEVEGEWQQLLRFYYQEGYRGRKLQLVARCYGHSQEAIDAYTELTQMMLRENNVRYKSMFGKGENIREARNT